MVSLRHGRNPEQALAASDRPDLALLRATLLRESNLLDEPDGSAAGARASSEFVAEELLDDPGSDLVRRSELSRDRSVRPLRSGPLRELLDAEFQRCHRFETISSFFGDLRSLLRKAVTREEDEDLEVEQYQRGERRLS